MRTGPEPISARPTRQPGRRSGCAIALYVFFGLGVLVLGGAGLGLWLFAQSEEGQQVLEAASRGAEWFAVATDAPGTDELREAGCEFALVNSIDSAAEIVMPFLNEDDSVRSDLAAFEGIQLVLCMAPRFAIAPPGCSEIARTYGSAIEFPPDRFAVIVGQQGADEPLCNGMYGPDGELLASFIPDVPDVPEDVPYQE